MTTEEKILKAEELLAEAANELESCTATGDNSNMYQSIDTVDGLVQTIKQFC